MTVEPSYLIWRGVRRQSIDRMIADGAERYLTKYGRPATEVRVNDLLANQVTFGGIDVVPDHRLPADEVWLTARPSAGPAP